MATHESSGSGQIESRRTIEFASCWPLADLGRLINFIKGSAVDADHVLAYTCWKPSCVGATAAIDAPQVDRDRV